jgi:hypothetical protein
MGGPFGFAHFAFRSLLVSEDREATGQDHGGEDANGVKGE